jgi:hypothetical protein
MLIGVDLVKLVRHLVLWLLTLPQSCRLKLKGVGLGRRRRGDRGRMCRVLVWRLVPGVWRVWSQFPPSWWGLNCESES